MYEICYTLLRLCLITTWPQRIISSGQHVKVRVRVGVELSLGVGTGKDRRQVAYACRLVLHVLSCFAYTLSNHLSSVILAAFPIACRENSQYGACPAGRATGLDI